MKKLFILISFLGLAGFVKAQDQAIFMHYHVTPILVNPAVAGFGDTHDLQFHFRNQWTGFPGSPFTYAFNYNGPIGKTFGIGASVLSENIASVSRFNFKLNYAFRFDVKKFKVAAGFSTEFQNSSLYNSVFQNGFYEEGDVIIDAFENGEKVIDATLGLFTTYNKTFYAGVSFPNLIVAKISDIETGDPQGSFFQFFTFQLGNKFEFSDVNFSLEPSMMVRKIMDVPFNLDFNVKAGFLDDQLIAGLSYRTGVGGAVGLLLGTEVNNLRVFYSYDVSFQAFQQYNGGSHEVLLAYSFVPKKNKNKN